MYIQFGMDTWYKILVVFLVLINIAKLKFFCYADIKYLPYNWYICNFKWQLILFQEDSVKYL